MKLVFEFNAKNVDEVLEAARQAIEDQYADCEVIFRGVHWVDRRLDYLMRYWLRRWPRTTFSLFGRYADCHPLAGPVTVDETAEQVVAEPTQAWVLSALAKGHDPRDWKVPADNTRFQAALAQWKLCVWAGNIQEQMKQPLTFSWALSPQGPPASPARRGKRPARQSRS